jgi:beta-N-acetylhexosaminidase
VPARDEALMLAFDGATVPKRVEALIRERSVVGFTLFRYRNVEGAAQVRSLTGALQAAAGDPLPLLIAADQEGGQLLALGEETTPFAGNMALGAVGDPGLAERVGAAVGREMRALGLGVNYAPVCDVATNPGNPSLGMRSFGDDPVMVAGLAAATVRGLQSEGVAATLKHFPGGGDATTDPHRELPLLGRDRDRLEAVEFLPFRAGIAAGARMLMVGHYDVPAITGRPGLPTSRSPDVVRLIREDLWFDGVIITDALDMGAVTGSAGPEAAAASGVDLLLHGPDAVERGSIRFEGRASRPGAVSRRVDALRTWVGSFGQPELGVVRCAEHLALARELAERSITLVRDRAGLLPLELPANARVAVVMPAPGDLTPADTSSAVAPGLASALRTAGLAVDEFLTGRDPTPSEIAALRDAAGRFDLLVVGTIDAWRGSSSQATLVAELVGTGVPTVAVALRTPHDLASYPRAGTYVCTYGILPPSMDALASALLGRIPFRGRLPAPIPGLYATGASAGR